ncbi:MAG: insulinase family protein [Tissierellia bacterium]|nr:insulinase family protein [Tissierellia bacterium]
MNYSHWIKRQGFTSKLKSYYYILPLTKERAVLGALLARVLERGSWDYPSAAAIQEREDELYGAAAYFDVNIYGSYLVFEGRLIYPNYLFLDKEELEVEALEYLDSLLYKPLLIDGNFREDFFMQEKEMLRQDLESLLKEPQSLALRKTMEILFEDSKFGLHRYGDLNTLEDVSLEDMTSFYKEALASPLYTYYHGDEDREDQGVKPCLEMDKVDEASSHGEIFLDLDVNQTNTVFAYSLPWQFKDERVYASLIFSHLLGGMATSQLFKKIREEDGLCYSIYSRYDRYRRLLLVVAGHEKDRYEDLKGGIGEVINGFCQGGFDLDQLAEAKLDLAIGLGSIEDSQGRQVRDCFIRDLFQDTRDIEKRISRLEEVTKEEVIEVARSLEPRLIYSVRNK